jgi:hypothetical protein
MAQQAEAGKPGEAEPPRLPEPTPPQPGGRDEPSDADAEPSEPSALFSWLRRSRTSPKAAAGNGKPAPGKQAAARPAPGKPDPGSKAGSGDAAPGKESAASSSKAGNDS